MTRQGFGTGAGRASTGKRLISVYVDAEQVAELDALAKLAQLTRSELLRETLQFGLPATRRFAVERGKRAEARAVPDVPMF